MPTLCKGIDCASHIVIGANIATMLVVLCVYFVFKGYVEAWQIIVGVGAITRNSYLLFLCSFISLLLTFGISDGLSNSNFLIFGSKIILFSQYIHLFACLEGIFHFVLWECGFMFVGNISHYFDF